MILITQKNSYRYLKWSSVLRERWGKRVQKITIDIGAGCPHRESLTSGGCIFCDSLGSGNGAHLAGVGLEKQIQRGYERLKKKYKTDSAILYFQSYSTTNIETRELVKIIERALEFSNNHGTAAGIAIGARPDQVPDEILEYLEDLAARDLETWLELGVQTTDPSGLKWLNRGHGLSEVEDSLQRIRKRKGISLCAHLIAGIPGEKRRQLGLSSKWLSEHGIDGVKFHPLHVLSGTPLEQLYRSGAFSPLSMEEYVATVVEALQMTGPAVVIQRLTADASPPRLVAPAWVRDKTSVLKAIDEKLIQLDARQGDEWDNGTART
ncbi:MAG: Radical SAM domain protein [Synergistales bacterium 53_16]|nr:MAG: Radical SAM domain protein [Synergistales bacterium 53_16]KUL05321.1 MAG: Radical SAM domain protein [Synergistales bacterium 54_9]MDK2845429.1 uncharacterized protein [Synergistales bacterium]MDN5336589.1 uncharacterized protein [Synergistales bacterium]